MAQNDARENIDTKQGVLYAGAAYLIWGFLPFYMKALAEVPAFEVIAHRIVWSVPISLIILHFLGLLGGLKSAFSSTRTILMGTLTASIISVNWGVYVWAVTSGRALETALGYYINPLFSVFLAAILLGEKLNKAQLIAIAFAIVAVGILTWDAGGLPWVSLALTLTWGAYAYFKKTLPVGPTEGFLLEVSLLALPALGYILWLSAHGNSHFLTGSNYNTWLLAGTGLVTAIPLILYANGAKLLRLSTIAIMQYSAPTMIFLIAVFVFKEPFSTAKLAAFGFIWSALAIYTWSLFQIHRSTKH